MALRFYLIPIESVQVGDITARGPKYLQWRFDPDPPALVTATYGFMDYGLMPVALVAADVTNGQHNSLNAQTDVVTTPLNIDNTIGAGSIATVRSRLEDLKIPGNTVQATDTYRNALRVVAGVFQFAQRFHGLYGRSIFDEVTGLNTTWGELSTEFQNELLATAQSMNIDTSGLTSSTTMRQIMRRMADAWEDVTFEFGGFTL